MNYYLYNYKLLQTAIYLLYNIYYYTGSGSVAHDPLLHAHYHSYYDILLYMRPLTLPHTCGQAQSCPSLLPPTDNLASSYTTIQVDGVSEFKASHSDDVSRAEAMGMGAELSLLDHRISACQQVQKYKY